MTRGSVPESHLKKHKILSYTVRTKLSVPSEVEVGLREGCGVSIEEIRTLATVASLSRLNRTLKEQNRKIMRYRNEQPTCILNTLAL